MTGTDLGPQGPGAAAHPAQRTCVGCRQVAPQAELVRHVLRDAQVVPDPQRRLPGRGAYLHPRTECLELATRRGGFARSFKTRVTGLADPGDEVARLGDPG